MDALKLSFTYPNPPADQVLTNLVTDLNVALGQIEPTSYLTLYTGGIGGITDASGAAGAVFYEDPSIFLKVGGGWKSVTVTDVSFG